MVLNKTLDFDTRVLHPEKFSTLALRLDKAVLHNASRTLLVHNLKSVQIRYLHLAADRGGCNLVRAQTKKLFAHFSAAAQIVPIVAQRLTEFG